VSCQACGEAWHSERIEPQCFDGECPILIDSLPPEALRVLGLRNMLIGLHDYGLSEMIRQEYKLNIDDLEMFCLIEAELEELRPKKENNG
jgi:hypothetical protein